VALSLARRDARRLRGNAFPAPSGVIRVERKIVGATCANYGCIPTKSLVASAHAGQLARRGVEYGVGTGEITVDMAKVKARKDKVMLGDRHGVESWLSGMDGCTFISGHARFEGLHTISVDGQLLEADKIFLNVVADLPGLSDIDYMTSIGSSKAVKAAITA
jgi:pyruvate/2-oxoglutarate dehydrogenase complex dihydrolipoamide dehydrogenase (E3) component